MIARISWCVPGLTALAGLVGCLNACGGASSATPEKGSTPNSGTTAPDAAPAPSPTPKSDGGNSDASGEDGGSTEDAAPAPRNATCTPTSQQTGTLINTAHGRLDGTLVYVLPPHGSAACNGDDSHIHLQIEVSGNVYDVAVDIGATNDEVGMYAGSVALPDGAWAEGWHGTDMLAYPDFGLHSTQFPLTAASVLAPQIEALLASTSKVSIFCTGYSSDNGCHDVHYENGRGNDGAIVLDPTSATSPVLFFRFQADTF